MDFFDEQIFINEETFFVGIGSFAVVKREDEIYILPILIFLKQHICQ